MSSFNQFGSSRQVPLGYESRAGSPVAVAAFFNAVYAWMAAGLGVTAVVAWYVSTQPQVMQQLFHGPLIWICFIAQIALVFAVANTTHRLSASTATVLFIIYAALNGLTLSVLLLFYAHAVLASAFMVTAGTFAAMSVYGYFTQRDLSGLGNLLFMALIGIVIASVVSIFWHSTMLTTLINYVGVLVFVGLTAYDTQKLKAMAYQTSGDAAMAARYSVTGALVLYLDFINLFLFLVQILGDNGRRR